jgi:cell division protein FtsL
VATARKHHPAGAVLPSHALPVLLILAAMAVGVAALLPLIQSSSATSTAGDVRALEAQRADQRARLRALELEVAGLGSLNRIEAEAKTRFGMGPPTQLHYIAVDAPAPEPKKLPSRYYSAAPDEESNSSSLFEDIADWLTP